MINVHILITSPLTMWISGPELKACRGTQHMKTFSEPNILALLARCMAHRTAPSSALPLLMQLLPGISVLLPSLFERSSPHFKFLVKPSASKNP